MDTSLPRRVWDRHTALADSALAIALTVAVWIQISVPQRLFERRLPPREGLTRVLRDFPPPLEAYLLVALCFLPLVLRRRNPLGVLAVVAIMVSLYSRLPLPLAMTQIAMLVALYTAGTLVDRKRFVPWAIAFGGLVLLTSLPPLESRMLLPDFAGTLAMLLGAAAIGDATRNRRAYVAEVEQRAIEAERMREEETSRRIDEERLRIARELHDITAHSLSIVAVQSGAALHVLDTDPSAARAALVAIRDTSRASLGELRGMLGVLRGDGEQTGAAPLTPAPGLSRIDELVGPLREAGLVVDVEVDLGTDLLPAMVDASAYRIVQEALTNVLRHAGKSDVRLSVRRDGERLEIEVLNDGPAKPAAGEGHGIAGMRERAAALGGTFEAGPAPHGGWRVFSVLPAGGRTT